MTLPKQILSAHFNALRSQSLEAIDGLGTYLARFAKVYPNPSHRTKQMKDVANKLYQQRLNSVERIRDLLKRMQEDVVFFGFSESIVSYVELTKARKNAMEHCVKLRVEWDRHNANAWTAADKQEMILFASSNAADTAAVFDTLHDAVVTFRIAITAYLDSAPFRTLASNMSDEQSKKLSQIVDSNTAVAAAQAAKAALKKRAHEEEGATTDLRQLESKRSKRDTEDGDDEDDEDGDDDESDDLIVVPDNAKIVREPKTILDDGSESFGDDESSSEVEAVVEKRKLRGGEKRAEIIKNIKRSEKIVRKMMRTQTILSDDEDAEDADVVNEETEDDAAVAEGDADVDDDEEDDDDPDDTESFEPQPQKKRNPAAAYIDDEAEEEDGEEDDDEDGEEDAEDVDVNDEESEDDDAGAEDDDNADHEDDGEDGSEREADNAEQETVHDEAD